MALYPENVPPKPVPRRDASGSRKLRARAIIFMVIALAAGLTAAVLVTRFVAGKGSAPAVPVAKVVVASVDMPLATTIKPDMLKVVDWPLSAQPQGSFGDVAALEGRVTGVALVAGEAVVEARLTGKGKGAGMAALIPPNMRAMTVHVNAVIGVGGFIHPGDLVDVITTMQSPVRDPNLRAAGNQDEYRSKIVLQNIRVLAVGEQLVTEHQKAENVPAVTLLVSPEESERLALASTQGKLQLTMRSQADSAEMTTPGVSPPELLATNPVDGGVGAPPPAPPPNPFAQAPRASRPVARPVAAAAAAPAPASAPTKGVEVVEVIRGDKIEQRKVNGTP